MIHISKTNLWNRLSDEEQRFAKRYKQWLLYHNSSECHEDELLLVICRCTDIMEKHLEQSVLSRLPYGYQSILKQSISSEEDDMGIPYMTPLLCSC